MTLKEKLDSIRAALDADVTGGVDIDSVIEKGKALAQLIGLSAECKAEAKKLMEKAKADTIRSLVTMDYSASLVVKIADGMCGEYIEAYEYADRLNAGIVHQLDYYRSVISLHKTELENSMK